MPVSSWTLGVLGGVLISLTCHQTTLRLPLKNKYGYISAHKHTDGCNQNKNRDEENASWSYIMSLVTLHKQMRRGELPIPPPALEE